MALLALGLLAQGCATTGNSNTSPNRNISSGKVQVDESATSLADYLRRVAGVYVMGSGSSVRVQIRGAQSINSSNRPLYVLNNQQIGRSYSTASSMVDVNDIDYIEVLKSSEGTSRYGLRGSNGVIIIRTKMPADKKASNGN